MRILLIVAAATLGAVSLGAWLGWPDSAVALAAAFYTYAFADYWPGKKRRLPRLILGLGRGGRMKVTEETKKSIKQAAEEGQVTYVHALQAAHEVAVSLHGHDNVDHASFMEAAEHFRLEDIKRGDVKYYDVRD